jgi:probable HAF family extracellular repeat protein
MHVIAQHKVWIARQRAMRKIGSCAATVNAAVRLKDRAGHDRREHSAALGVKEGSDMDAFHSCALRASILLLTGFAVFAANARAETHEGAETYVLTDLGAASGTDSFATGINAAGEIVGGISIAGGPDELFVYTRGQLVIQTVPGLDPADSVEPSGINDVGQVTGFGCCLEGSPSSFIYDFETHAVTVIPVGFESSVAQINDRGQATGEASQSATMGPDAYLFNSRSGTFSPLGSLAPDLFNPFSSGNGINREGSVTGAADTESRSQHAFLSEGGQMTDLGTLGGENSVGNGINRADAITGWSDTASGAMHAFVYVDGTMRDLGTLGGDFSEGNSINASREIVGDSSEADNATIHAFIYRNHKMTDLNRLIDPRSPLARFVTLMDAVGINNRGEIAANGSDSRTGETHAYLLIPKNRERDEDRDHRGERERRDR